MIDEEKIKKAMASMIEAIGEDTEREGLADTPRRVAEMYSELFSGLEDDPAGVLTTGFEEDHHEMVVLKRVPFSSVCEHHFLPFVGKADIGYIPNGKVVGASKLARALDILARRPQLQERLARQLADAIVEAVKPKGVGVIIRAEHPCMAVRGVKKPGSEIVTTVTRGSFKTRNETLREFHSLLGDG